MGPAALDVQAPCTLELSRSQPCLGASDMLHTPPSSPVAGRVTSYKPDWDTTFKMSQWRSPYSTYPYQEPLQQALSIRQLSRPEPLPVYSLQTAYSEPPAMHAADGEQVVPQRVHEPLAEAVPSAAADWVAPPVMPQAAHSPVWEQQHAAPTEHRAAGPLQPVRHRVLVQAAADHQLAPSSPSPMEQGRVLPEFAELAPAAQRQPQHARDADNKQKTGYSWMSMLTEPQGAALAKKDLQQPLSSLESVGTPLGRHSPAPEAAPLSTGQQAESPHAKEQPAHVSTAEPDLPPKKRRHVREMTPPPIAAHQWAPIPVPKPAFEAQRSPAVRARQHEEQEWDAVVPKRQRRHRLVSGDSSSSSSAAAFEHRPVIPADAPASNIFLEAHSAPQKDQSDPLCMLLDAAEELRHHQEDYVTGPMSRTEYTSGEPRSLQEAWAAGDMAVYPYAKSLATKTSISGLVIQKEWVQSLMEPNEHKNNTAVNAVTDSGQAWPITFYLNKDRRELRGPPDGQPGGWANLRRALNAQPTDVAVLWKEYGMAHRSFRLSVLPKSMVPQGIHLAP